jgi:hypothetical protein
MEYLINDPVLFVSSITLILSQLCMGGIAKDYLGATGFSAYWLVASPSGIFYYIEIKRKNKEKVGWLPWLYVVALVITLYRRFW